MTIGLLCSRLRVEEKQLLEACARRNLAAQVLDDAHLRFELGAWAGPDLSVVLDRSADPWRGAYAVRLFELTGRPCVNRYAVAETCSNKLLMSAALLQTDVPHPRTAVAFTVDEALAAAESIGYPVLFKPAIGAWEHLLGKANDREAAEAILEHKQVLGTYHHSVFYIQEYVAKPGRDLRLLVVGDQAIAGVYRMTDHWSPETARDVSLKPCALTTELVALAQQAARAVGGGILAVDLVEDLQRGYLVIEVGPVRDFRHIAACTGHDVADAIIDYTDQIARSGGHLATVRPTAQAV